MPSHRSASFRGFPAEVARNLIASPWFARLMDSSGLLPDELVDPRAIEHFPWMQRAQLADAIEDLLVIDEQLRPIYSTGTSGIALRVYRGRCDERRFQTLLHRELSLTNDARVIFLCTLPEGAQYREARIERVSLLRNPARAKELAQTADLLTGSPAMLPWLRAHAPTNAAVYTTALPLDAADLLPRHLHTYSTTETGPIAHLCRISGDYHAFDDVYIEKAGARRFAVTKLFASALPLIRYVTDDSGVIHHKACRCGFSGASIAQLVGRKTPAHWHKVTFPRGRSA
jgi:phenylacetate-coenzyme A ligase PaaK-like adenylate-forming protein